MIILQAGWVYEGLGNYRHMQENGSVDGAITYRTFPFWRNLSPEAHEALLADPVGWELQQTLAQFKDEIVYYGPHKEH